MAVLLSHDVTKTKIDTAVQLLRCVLCVKSG